jgi:hypothetical protein
MSKNLQNISKLKIRVRKMRKIGIKVSESETRKNVMRNNYINGNNDNNDDPFGYFAIEKFAVRNNIIMSPSFQDYSKGNLPLKRKIIIYSHCILQLIFLIKFALISIINKPWIWNLLADPLYILRLNHSPAIMYGFMMFIFLVSQQTSIIFERNMKFEFISLISRIKNNEEIYKLNEKYFEKFCRRVKLVTKLFFGPLFIAIVLIIIVPFGYLSIKAYFDSEMDFSLIKLMINYITFAILIIHGVAIACIAFVMYYLTTLYLKYHFLQIKEQIQRCVTTGNSGLLIDAIHEHNYFTQLTQKLNEMLSIGLGIIYFCGTPTLDILLHLAIHSKNIYMRSFYTPFFIQLLSCILIFNLIISQVSTAAHNITSDLYKFLARNQTRKISLEIKLKISTFIEKLCGPTIGFYCFDWFPFTSLELYEYMYFITGTYFLLSDLIF